MKEQKGNFRKMRVGGRKMPFYRLMALILITLFGQAGCTNSDNQSEISGSSLNILVLMEQQANVMNEFADTEYRQALAKTDSNAILSHLMNLDTLRVWSIQCLDNLSKKLRSQDFGAEKFPFMLTKAMENDRAGQFWMNPEHVISACNLEGENNAEVFRNCIAQFIMYMEDHFMGQPYEEGFLNILPKWYQQPAQNPLVPGSKYKDFEYYDFTFDQISIEKSLILILQTKWLLASWELIWLARSEKIVL